MGVYRSLHPKNLGDLRWGSVWERCLGRKGAQEDWTWARGMIKGSGSWGKGGLGLRVWYPAPNRRLGQGPDVGADRQSAP